MFSYKTKGTCSVQIDIDIDENNIIQHCEFHRGCHGNAIGVARLVQGRNANEVKDTLRGVACRGQTSCPDQLSKAIEAYQNLQKGATK